MGTKTWLRGRMYLWPNHMASTRFTDRKVKNLNSPKMSSQGDDKIHLSDETMQHLTHTSVDGCHEDVCLRDDHSRFKSTTPQLSKVA
jgi:hypothetical protein